MRQLKLYSIILLSALTIMSCGGGDGGSDSTNSTPSTPPKTYTQSETIDAKGGEKVITLVALRSSITSISNSTNWVVASPQFYSEGAPKLQLNVTENKEKDERKCEITITSQSSEKVILTLTQQGAKEDEPKTGIDDTHDNVTTQPAYSPKR